MPGEQAYETPGAFRQALNAQLRVLARDSTWGLQQLQRQVAYDRLLERLYHESTDWVVKGAAALIARGVGTRATLDVDLYREAPIVEVELAFRRAAAHDLDDWFRFELGATQPIRDGARGVRVPVRTYVGLGIWVSFQADLVGDEIRMTGDPEHVPGIPRIVLPEVRQGGYRAYPIVDHVADKVAATFQRYGRDERPSTRYRDLLDLAEITRRVTIDASALRVAIETEFSRRNLSMPDHFDVPERELWRRGYASEARRAGSEVEGLDEALGTVRALIDPVLEGSARGTWVAERQAWTEQ